MAIKSGITLTETDPANIDTPSTGKITIFQDATMSPPQPAYKSEDGSVSSLVGPPGPEGPAGPTGSITVNPNGALDGDGSGGSPLGVRVDGVTIGINASNELEAIGGGSGTVVNDVTLTAGATVIGAGGAHVVVDTVTSDLVDRTAGVLGSVSVGSGLQKSGGTLSASVDNETIGTDSNGKLQVIANYILKGVVRLGLHFVNGWLDVNVDNETIGIDSQNKLQVIQSYLSQLAITPQGRLTLTSEVPDMVSSVTGATTIYYTPVNGPYVPVYNGSKWTPVAIGQLFQTTTDTTKSPAACANNSNYDLFVWNDAGTMRCTRGPLWSSDTTRGTGAGTTELVYVSGLLMNANAITNGPAARRGVYVGTIRTNGSAQVDMIFGGVGAAGGESTILGIWNMYNRRLVSLVNFDNTDSWNYTTATLRIKDGNNNNKISFVVGYRGDGIHAVNSQVAAASVANDLIIAIGFNSTSAAAVGSGISQSHFYASPGPASLFAQYGTMAPLGFNYIAPLEYSGATGTTTWYGDNGAATYSTFTMTTMF